MALTDKNLLIERTDHFTKEMASIPEALWQSLGRMSHEVGVQRIYRVGNWGLSLVNNPILHSFPFAWEAAVLHFMDGPTNAEGYERWSLTYEAPFCPDVAVFTNEAETISWMERAFAWFEKNPTHLNSYTHVKGWRTRKSRNMHKLFEDMKNRRLYDPKAKV